MAFSDTGLTLEQAKQRPEWAGLKQIDPGVYQGTDGTYYGMGPSGTVQSTTNLADFHIGQSAPNLANDQRSRPVPQPTPMPTAAPTATASAAAGPPPAPDFWTKNAPPGSPLSKPYVAPQFTPPTGIDMQNDPGYRERMDLANQGLERSAAARGTILSGGFQQELAKYNQDYASNEFQHVYNRALGTFNTNTQGALAGRQQNQGEYQSLVNNTLGARQQNFNEYQGLNQDQLGARQQNWNEYQGGVNNNNTQYGNQYGAYLNENARKLNDYLTNANIRRGSEQDLWGRYRDLYTGGIDAAGKTRLS